MTAPSDRVAGQLNPYAAPESSSILPTSPANAEAIRRQHRGTENSLRILGIFSLLLGLSEGTHWLRQPAESWTRIQLDPMGRLGDLAAFAVLPLALGLSLLLVHPAARQFGNLGAVAVSFQVDGCAGGLIGGFILCLVHLGQAKIVLDPSYKDIRRATPEQNRWFWIAIACCLTAGAILWLVIDALDSIGSGPGR